MRLTIKQLVHAAYQAARYLPKASAQLMRDLAERLDTTQAALCESLKIRDALAAENAALKEYAASHAQAIEHWNGWADAEDKIPPLPETPATDAGGHDVEKSTVTRLSQYGVLHQVRPGYHEVTEFGEFILNGGIDELQQYRAAAKPVCYALTNSEGEVYNTHSSPENAEAYMMLIHQSDDTLTLRVTPLYAAPQLTSVEREELEQYRAAEPVLYCMEGDTLDEENVSTSKAVVDAWVEEWNGEGRCPGEPQYRTVPLYRHAAPQVTSVPDKKYLIELFEKWWVSKPQRFTICEADLQKELQWEAWQDCAAMLAAPAVQAEQQGPQGVKK